MHPGVDVGFATEVANRVGPFELPHVPDFVIADVLPFVEGEVKVVDATGFDMFECFFGVSLAEGREEVGDDFANVIFLVACQVCDPNTFEPLFLAG